MAAPAVGVLSAHSVIAEYMGNRDKENLGLRACFATRRYLRYAQPNKEHGLPAQEEWCTPVGSAADAQTAAMAEEVEGALSAVIDGLVAGPSHLRPSRPRPSRPRLG